MWDVGITCKNFLVYCASKGGFLSLTLVKLTNWLSEERKVEVSLQSQARCFLRLFLVFCLFFLKKKILNKSMPQINVFWMVLGEK